MGNVFFKADLLPKHFVAIFLIAVPTPINNSNTSYKKYFCSIIAVTLCVSYTVVLRCCPYTKTDLG